MVSFNYLNPESVFALNALHRLEQIQMKIFKMDAVDKAFTTHLIDERLFIKPKNVWAPLIHLDEMSLCNKEKACTVSRFSLQ